MGKKRKPKLRTVDKVTPPYPLGQFPNNFIITVGKQIIYLLATKSKPSLEGNEWEEIFANAINATWKPSNVGLDDIVLGSCAWGAKTVKASNPWETKKVRLISGRNSPVYSYGSVIDTSSPPDEIGKEVLEIWNARVEAIRSKYGHVRTVVLIKSSNLLKLAIFEVETIRYDSSLYRWIWNKRGNLEGWRDDKHCFTWQPHGSQFTIIEDVPDNKVCFQVKSPGKIEPEAILKHLGFDESWIQIKKFND